MNHSSKLFHIKKAYDVYSKNQHIAPNISRLTRGGCSDGQHPPPTTPGSWVSSHQRRNSSNKGGPKGNQRGGKKISQGFASSRPSHDVSSNDQHQNHDDHFYLSFSLYPCLCFDLYADVCVSYALCPSPCPYLCAFYASYPCLSTHF